MKSSLDKWLEIEKLFDEHVPEGVPYPIKGDKGEKGDTPTREELLALIKPLIPAAPEPINGEDGHTPTSEELLEIIKPLIPEPIKGDKGDAGQTIIKRETIKEELTLTEDTARKLIKLMRKLPEKDRLEIQDIRNAQTFVKDGIRYKIEELMHGAGKAGAVGSVYYTPTGIVNAVNNVFGVTAQPSSVIADGITYFENAGYTYSALHVTLDVPPSQYIRYTL